MEVKAWMQMGCERREVSFEVPDAEVRRLGAAGLERYIEDRALEWIYFRFAWGWSCELIGDDLGYMEDGESSGLVAPGEILHLATTRRPVSPRGGVGARDVDA